MVTALGQPEEQAAEVIEHRGEPDHGRRDRLGRHPQEQGRDAEEPQHAEGVGENPHECRRCLDQLGQRLVEVERDHAGEEDIEEHQGRAPEALARQRVGQSQGQADDDRLIGAHRSPSGFGISGQWTG